MVTVPAKAFWPTAGMATGVNPAISLLFCTARLYADAASPVVPYWSTEIVTLTEPSSLVKITARVAIGLPTADASKPALDCRVITGKSWLTTLSETIKLAGSRTGCLMVTPLLDDPHAAASPVTASATSRLRLQLVIKPHRERMKYFDA